MVDVCRGAVAENIPSPRLFLSSLIIMAVTFCVGVCLLIGNHVRGGAHLLVSQPPPPPTHTHTSGWPTFLHVTAANRLGTQEWLYIALARHLHRSLDLRAPFASAPSSSSSTANGHCT